LVDSVESMMMHGLANPRFYPFIKVYRRLYTHNKNSNFINTVLNTHTHTHTHICTHILYFARRILFCYVTNIM